MIFFALCRKLSVWYFKQGCDRFLAQPFQFVTRLTSVSYGLVNNLVKAFLNEPQIFDHCKKFVMSHLFHFLICFINSVIIIIIITLHYCCTLYSTLMKESVCIYLPTFPFWGKKNLRSASCFCVSVSHLNFLNNIYEYCYKYCAIEGIIFNFLQSVMTTWPTREITGYGDTSDA